MIKDPFKVIDGIDLQMRRIRNAPVDEYRRFVWKVFTEILSQTPQFSGKAVANWNVSSGSPDYGWDDTLGDDVGDLFGPAAFDETGSAPRSRGDNVWIRVAKQRAQSKYGSQLSKLPANQKVFITNAVWGDSDNGRSSNLYLESLQDPSYWVRKLRDANRPYEVAAETLMRVVRDYKRGIGLAITRAGGDSLERYDS